MVPGKPEHDYTLWSIKSATVFWTVTPMFPGRFLQFFYQ